LEPQILTVADVYRLEQGLEPQILTVADVYRLEQGLEPQILTVADVYRLEQDLEPQIVTVADVYRLEQGLEPQILTVADVYRLEQDLEPQHCDAFLLFADEDQDFGLQIVDRMETEYGLKVWNVEVIAQAYRLHGHHTGLTCCATIS
jgi:hypothetical protein